MVLSRYCEHSLQQLLFSSTANTWSQMKTVKSVDTARTLQLNLHHAHGTPCLADMLAAVPVLVYCPCTNVLELNRGKTIWRDPNQRLKFWV